MDLKADFPEFDPWPDDFFRDLWKRALITFDTNSLIDLYSMEPATREQLFTFLESVKERVWIPYQVAYEFRKNRHRGMTGQINKYKAAISSIEDAGKTTKEAYSRKIKEAIAQLKDSRMPAVVTTGEQLSTSFGALEKKVAECVAALEKDIKGDLDALLKPLRAALKEQEGLFQSDPILDRLTSLFEGRIGARPSVEQLHAWYAQGEARYGAEPPVPPGFEDADNPDKPGNRKYGDLIVWLSVVEYAKERGLPVILVNNEKKGDWVETSGRQSIARRELTREFFDVTGRHFWLYATEAFMAAAGRFAGFEFSKEAIADAAKVVDSEQPEVVRPKNIRWISDRDRSGYPRFVEAVRSWLMKIVLGTVLPSIKVYRNTAYYAALSANGKLHSAVAINYAGGDMTLADVMHTIIEFEDKASTFRQFPEYKGLWLEEVKLALVVCGEEFSARELYRIFLKHVVSTPVTIIFGFALQNEFMPIREIEGTKPSDLRESDGPAGSE